MKGVTQVSSFTNFTGILNSKHQCYLFGYNKHKQVSEENKEAINVPVLLAVKVDIAQISCGFSHTLLIGSDGRVFSKGTCKHGALCLKSKKTSTFFDECNLNVSGKTVLSIQPNKVWAGRNISFMRDKDNTLYAAGIKIVNSKKEDQF